MNVVERRGTLRVSKEALCEMAAEAVCETGRALCSYKDVAVKYAGGVVRIYVALKLKKEINVIAYSETIQNAVRESIQNMTGITVSRVDLEICGQA